MMQLDAANYQLQSLAPFLVEHGARYEREQALGRLGLKAEDDPTMAEKMVCATQCVVTNVLEGAQHSRLSPQPVTAGGLLVAAKGMSKTSVKAVHARWLATLVTQAHDTGACPETLVCDAMRLAQIRKEAAAAVYCAVAVMVATGYNDRLAGNRAFVGEVTRRVWALTMDAATTPEGTYAKGVHAHSPRT